APERPGLHALLPEVHRQELRRVPDGAPGRRGLPSPGGDRPDRDAGLLRRRLQQSLQLQPPLPGRQGSDPEGVPAAIFPLKEIPMKYGMNMLLWTDDCTGPKIPPIFERLKGMGFDAVEVPILNVDAKKLRDVARTLDGLGLARTGATCLSPERNLISEDRRQRAAGVAHLKSVIDGC